MAFTCRACGDEGHYARSCPNTEILDARPPWCGVCDPDTRLVALNADGTLCKRCPDCHETPGRPLPQHARCGKCKQVIYKWDAKTDCDKHIAIGVPIQPFTKAS